MAGLDDRIIPKVAKLFGKLNLAGRLRTYPAAVRDDVAGTVTRGAPTDVTVRTSSLLNYARKLVDGDVVKAGDCYVIIEGAGIPRPTTAMKYVAPDGGVWSIERVTTHSGGVLPAAYELQLRGSA